MTDREIFLANVKLPVKYGSNIYITTASGKVIAYVESLIFGISERNRNAIGRFIAEAINEYGESKDLPVKTTIINDKPYNKTIATGQKEEKP